MKRPQPQSQDSTLTITGAHPARRLDDGALEHLVRQVIDGERVRLHHLSVVLADHDTVHDLNRTYLDHDYRTDVLSFPFTDRPDVVDGEVYVDLDTAAERCTEFGSSFEEEARRYVVHGLLHLIGYDDEDGRTTMRTLEDRYLAAARSPRG